MKKVLRCAIFLISMPSLSNGQIWEGRDAGFPTSLFGGSVYAIDEAVAWCIGVEVDTSNYFTWANNAISVTSDGGLTWHHVPLPTSDSSFISSLWALNDQIAWLTYVKVVNGFDAGNFIYETNDRGQSWHPLDLTVNQFVDFIYMWAETEGLVVGDPDGNGFEIYRTSDGMSWERNLGLPLHLNNEFIYADNYTVKGDQMWFGTSRGRIFHTPDRGVTWEVWSSPFGGFESINMAVSDNGDVYQAFYNYINEVDGADCFIYRRNASDGQWINITESYHNYYLYDIKPIPGSNVILSTVNDGLGAGLLTRISYDRGSTWIVIDDQTEVTYFDFYDAEVGYTSQFNLGDDHSPTLVYRYIGSPLTGLIKQTPLLDVDLRISPNPTSEFVNIYLKSETPDDYWILLNDFSGRLIARQEFLSVSEIHHQLNLKSLPAGVYTLTISSKDGLLTEKIVRQ